MKTTTSLLSILLISIFFLSNSHSAKAQLDTNDFVSTWRTNNSGESFESNFSGDSSIHINIDNNYTYNYDVDWNNDGVFDTTGLTGSITHQFSDTGTFTIRIRGQFPSLKLGGELFVPSDKFKITFINQWGNQIWRNLDSAFLSCRYVKFIATDVPNLDSITTLFSFLEDAQSFNSNINHWDISSITNLNNTFKNAINFNQPLNNWDVSFVADMTAMFYGTDLFNQPLNNWDVSNVTDMESMFIGSNFNQPIDQWDVSNVTDMHGMFASSKFNQALSSWDVSSVTDMHGMFASSKFNQALSSWDVSSVTDMSSMFRGAQNFNQSINSWDVSSVTDMRSMFEYSQFNQNLNNWDVSSVTRMRWMFKYSYFNQNLNNWDISSVTDMRSMFEYSQFNQNLGDWSFNSLVNLSGILSYSKLSKTNYDSTLIGWQTKPVPLNSFVGANHLMFCNGKAARDLLISNGWNFGGDILNCDSTDMIFTWQTDASSNVTIHIDSNYTYNYDVDWDNDGVFDSIGVSSSIDHQFNNAGTYPIKIRGVFPSIKFYPRSSSVFISLVGFNQWGNIEIKNLDSAFMNCSNLFFNPVDVPNLDSVTSLRETFKSVSGIANISNWDVSNVTNMSGLFSISGINLPLNSWDVSNVTDMSEMFRGAWGFNQPIGSWDVSSVTDMSSMFRGAQNFNQSINSWDVSNVRDISWMFNEAYKFNQPLNSWDISAVRNISYLFFAALDFDQPLNSWDVSNVWDMTWVFQSAISFNQPLNNWDVSKVTQMYGMFSYAFKFNQPLHNWDVSKVKYMNRMFEMGSFTGEPFGSFNQNLGSWDISSILEMDNMFDYSVMNVSNYDSTLIGWQSNPHLTNVTLGANVLKYCLGEAARDSLIADGWSFVGDTIDSACIVTAIEKSSEVTVNLFKLYPNPTQGMLFIEIDQADQNTPLLIYNQVGQVVKEARLVNGRNQINLVGQAKGVYFVRYDEISEKVILID